MMNLLQNMAMSIKTTPQGMIKRSQKIQSKISLANIYYQSQEILAMIIGNSLRGLHDMTNISIH